MPTRSCSRRLLEALDALPDGEQVMLKLSLPGRPACSQPLVDHPRVLRVVALVGRLQPRRGLPRAGQNPGMIASFCRALLDDLRHQMSDEEFDRALGRRSTSIYAASIAKGPPLEDEVEALGARAVVPRRDSLPASTVVRVCVVVAHCMRLAKRRYCASRPVAW